MCMLHFRVIARIADKRSNLPCRTRRPVSHQRTVKDAAPRLQRKGARARFCCCRLPQPFLHNGCKEYENRPCFDWNGTLCGVTALRFPFLLPSRDNRPRHARCAETVVLKRLDAAANSPSAASPSRPLCATVSGHPLSSNVRAPSRRPARSWHHYFHAASPQKVIDFGPVLQRSVRLHGPLAASGHHAKQTRQAVTAFDNCSAVPIIICRYGRLHANIDCAQRP